MKSIKFFVFILFTSSILSSQEHTELPSVNTLEFSNWEYDGFSSPDFGTGEQHSHFSILYKMNPKLIGELRGFYDTYRVSDVLDVSYRIKWYPSKKVYLFSGVGVQFQRAKVGTGVPIIPFRIMNGMGYKPSENISIEAIHDFNFDKNTVGLRAAPSLFSLKGKYRF